MEENILEVKRLKVSFRTDNGTVKAVRDISFNLKKGKTLAIVGESGSGKSVTSKVILGISAGNAIIEGGEVLYAGKDIVKLTEEEMCNIRGDKISMIFQDPLSSLNPIVHIGQQITEAMLIKNKEKRKRGRKEFNTKLKFLENYTSRALEKEGAGKEEIEKYKAKCKEFDDFNIAGLEMENAYNLSLGHVDDLISDIKDFVFLYEHNRKVNFVALCRSTVLQLKQIMNPFLVRGGNIGLINDFSTYFENAKKEIKNAEKEKLDEIVEKFKELETFASSLKEQDTPNFFRYGYHKLHHGEEDLLKLSIAEANEKCLEELNTQFMDAFIKESCKGINEAYQETLEGKKAAIKYLEEGLALFANEQLDKEMSFGYASRSKEIINASINPLDINKDTVAYTFTGALKDFVKKYFRTQIDNQREQRRFERQSARMDALLAKGKKIDWKVVPAKYIDLNDIRNDILSLIQRLHDNYVTFVKDSEANALDLEKECIALIDQFKQHASDAVYRLTKREAKEKAIKLMEEVGIPEARIRFKQYPFEFSGGMRQRIVIAIALSADPDILICDEPTTALDVTIQAQILELINKIKEERKLSVIFITHDLGVVANMADEIAVMYAGKIVEIGTSEEIFYSPAHPYTWALLSSMPDLDTKEKLEAIPGTPPNMIFPPKGDAFAARNKYALKIDFEEQPPMFKISDTHYAATWLLHPKAPKVEMPEAIRKRIQRMRKKEANTNGK